MASHPCPRCGRLELHPGLCWRRVLQEDDDREAARQNERQRRREHQAELDRLDDQASAIRDLEARLESQAREASDAAAHAASAAPLLAKADRCLAAGDTEGAMLVLQRARSLEPDSPTVHIHLARAFKADGDRISAARHGDLAWRYGPSAATARAYVEHTLDEVEAYAAVVQKGLVPADRAADIALLLARAGRAEPAVDALRSASRAALERTLEAMDSSEPVAVRAPFDARLAEITRTEIEAAAATKARADQLARDAEERTRNQSAAAAREARALSELAKKLDREQELAAGYERARVQRAIVLVLLFVLVGLVIWVAQRDDGRWLASLRGPGAAALAAETEAHVNGIRLAEAAYKSAFDVYVPATLRPRRLQELDNQRVNWANSGAFNTLGWAPDGPVAGSYEVHVTLNGEDYSGPAPGAGKAQPGGEWHYQIDGWLDADSDGVRAHWRATDQTPAVRVSAPDVW